MDVRTRIPITTTYDPEFIEELDQWLAQQPYRLPRASFLEAAGKKMLAEEKAKAAAQYPRSTSPEKPRSQKR